jgi:erythromycin esterase-like protein
MKHRRALITLSLLLACGGDRVPTVVGPPHPPSTLPDGVHALAGVAAAQSTADLQPLRVIIGDARFVALGESTHTSGGYYAMKARIIRFMIEELGFRAVAWETPWLEAEAARRYVATCEGSPEAALGSLFGVWRDTHTRDLLRWLCERNRANPSDPVTFFGFDIQEPWKSVPAVQQFVQRVAPGDTRADPLRRCLGGSSSSMNAFYSSQEFRDHISGVRNHAANDACMATLTSLESWITGNAAAFEAGTSAADVERVRLALIALRAMQEQLWIPDPGGYSARDGGMATLLRRLQMLYAPGQRTAVWAWNWHIALRYQDVFGWNDDRAERLPRQGGRSMGSYLHEALGDDYLPIALIGHRVLTWSPSSTPPVTQSMEAVERRLLELGRPYLLADLRRAIPGTLLPAGRVWQISQEWADPYAQFGALIWLEHSPAMTSVPAP